MAKRLGEQSRFNAAHRGPTSMVIRLDAGARFHRDVGDLQQ